MPRPTVKDYDADIMEQRMVYGYIQINATRLKATKIYLP